MNKLDSRQRKIVYTVILVVLLVPILVLGMPSSSQKGSGGVLARMRIDNELGEASLGNVDPSSATMSFLLMGMRGIAVNRLWMQATEQQKKKDWSRLRTTINSIILLEPHFLKVWDFQGWNMAYNVSAEWDGVTDRFYWVKEGIRFLKRGAAQNDKYAKLHESTGDVVSKKFKVADEWRQYRRYFFSDPDPTFEGGPDPDLNPSQLDPHLVAKVFFEVANDRDKDKDPLRWTAYLLRGRPSKELMSYAEVMQKEGKFGERTAEAWANAYNHWTTKYGEERFKTPEAGIVKLELYTTKDLESLVTEDGDQFTAAQKLAKANSFQKTTNYNFWRTLARAEMDRTTANAHRLIHEGQQQYLNGKTAPEFYDITLEGERALTELASQNNEEKLSEEDQLTFRILDFLATTEGDITEAELDKAGLLSDDAVERLEALEQNKQYLVRLSRAQKTLEEGMKKYQETLERYPELRVEDLVKEESQLAVRFWQENFVVNEIPVPKSFPLKDIWMEAIQSGGLAEIERLFRRKVNGL